MRIIHDYFSDGNDYSRVVRSPHNIKHNDLFIGPTGVIYLCVKHNDGGIDFIQLVPINHGTSEHIDRGGYRTDMAGTNIDPAVADSQRRHPSNVATDTPGDGDECGPDRGGNSLARRGRLTIAPALEEADGVHPLMSGPLMHGVARWGYPGLDE